MNKKLIAGISLACAMFLSTGLAACGKGNSNGGMNAAKWNTTVEAFITESGVTAELELFADHFGDFTLADGKYTAGEIEASGGFVCKNVVVTLQNGKIVKVEYELRTESKDTPDRIVTIDKDGIETEDVPKPSDNTQMDEDEWQDLAATFTTRTNYSLRRDSIATGQPVASMKLDGETYYEEWGGIQQIWDKDGSDYILYSQAKPTAAWNKDYTTQENYEDAIGIPSSMVEIAAGAIEANFAAFAFEAGVYTAEEVTFTYGDLKDVTITVSGGNIVRVICTLVGGYTGNGDERITVDHVGSTTIDFPEDYIDNTTGGSGGSDVQGSETTQNQWSDQFALTNFTAAVHITGDSAPVSEILAKFNGETVEYNQTTYQGETQMIFAKDNGQYYMYMEVAGKWYRTPAGDDTATMFFTYQEIPALFAEDFSAFTYEDGKYTCASSTKTLMDVEYNFTDIEVVFGSDGKLVSFQCTTEQSGNTIKFEYSAFGTTQVTVPTDYITG